MMTKKLLFILLMCLLGSCSEQTGDLSVPEVSSGKIRRIENFASDFVTARHVDIWVPDGYSHRQRYTVLYMHDGQMLFDSSLTWNGQEWGVDETLSQLMDDQRIDRCMVVGIWNAGPERHPDYFPQKPFERLPEVYRDSLIEQVRRPDRTAVFSKTAQSDNYLRFLVEELKPFIDQHYTTKTGREHTFIAGSSMGGLISLYAICEYPEVFGGAACLSTHWTGTFTAENNPIPEAIIEYLNTNLPDPANHKIYFDYGTGTLDGMYEPFQVQVDSIMMHRGYDENNWKTLKFEGADHSENAWRARLHIPMTFLMGRDSLK